jgi:hypothetical protein
MCSQMIHERSDGMRPLEMLEREITSLASQIHAATCRWLELVAEYDAREGWAQWGCRSCAHWVSWQCGIAPGPAREHVRVARRLRELPAIRASFAAGELSFSKVRALTRVENVEREADLLELARHATASQLERLLRAYRGVVATERAVAGGRPERWLAIDHDDDGCVVVRGRLPAEEGALLVAALEAAQDDLARREDSADGARDVPAGTPREARAEALVALADTFLAGGHGSRTGGDRYQVLVHVDAPVLSRVDESGRCELDDGAPLAVETARRLACDASVVRMLEQDGKPLRIGRKTRSIPPALRRALSARDHGCRFPGCGSRRFVDAHHIEHWADGGPTDLDNLVQLCGAHHRLLHEGGFGVDRSGSGGLIFRRPDGRRIPDCPHPPRAQARRLERTRRPDACVPVSHDRLDLELAVEAVLTFAPVATGEPPGV